MGKKERKRSKKSLLFNTKQWITILLSFAVAALTHLPKLSHIPYVVFDETHFGGFISDYIRGICFFDIHPPLAKLMLAGVGKITGYDGSFNFSKADVKYTSNFYVPLRALPAISCTLVSPLITATLLLKGVNCLISFFGGFLFAIDFMSITQSRLILTDGILYFFVSLTIFLTSLYERNQCWSLLILQAISAGCCISIKFTGASVLVYIAFSHLRLLYKSPQWFIRLVVRGIVIFIVCVLILYGTIAIHLKLLPKRGFGDKYMRSDFRQKPMLTRITLLIAAMYRYNSNLKFTHPYQSKWYEWPLSLSQPILVYSAHMLKTLLFFFNNPVVAFISLIGFILAINRKDYLFAIGYLISYLPFIAVTRCTFNYHYEISVIFGILAFCHFLGRVPKKIYVAVVMVVGLLAIAAFIFWFNWIYGVDASFRSHEKRMFWKTQRKNFGIE
ncbi:Dolichyl-phosphate-mannose-protein mannosyltransferase [Histomonas meleagridis]|uniref:Dolichyl-phosphate-mannose-protein mannosyltransferase n=1 Tax=Histomonas meleagridis TaxID=135588 RepID=UPI00355AC5CB|nr:Dolichyl-phosphate-mannose-protein mannosyltransferase [Histomonas meleagridis]KAH0806402.1 Dolichyl-phosphate-mannose-protein mannosyltransferase [Histomonas meleagridis]